MKIAVDCMGGDQAPGEIVQGALAAARDHIAQIILVGDPPKLEPYLTEMPSGVELLPAKEVIGMDEQPATAFRKKKDASIVVAAKAVQEGKAAALVSAGSTGAQMTATLLMLGRIKGISRPAICAMFPTVSGSPCLILDVGANVDVKPQNLVQFAIMGEIYARSVLKIDLPRVGLLNIGSEENKGNELVINTYPLLKALPLNFIGNIEPRDLPLGAADVVVCDGFVGNSLLKLGEGLSKAIFDLIRQEVNKSLLAKAGAALIMPALKNLNNRLDYAEYGGAPLLGVKGVSMVCHGSSDAKTIKNAVAAAARAVESGFVTTIARQVEEVGEVVD